jgi:hypothetical protein
MLGRAEAYNFAKLNNITGENLLNALNQSNGTLTSQAIIDICTIGKLGEEKLDLPWGNKTKLSQDSANLWVDRYSFYGSDVTIQSIQNTSYTKLAEILEVCKQGEESIPSDDDVTFVANGTGVFLNIKPSTRVYFTSIVLENYESLNQALGSAIGIREYEDYAAFMMEIINNTGYDTNKLLEKTETTYELVNQGITYTYVTCSISKIPGNVPGKDYPTVHKNALRNPNEPLFMIGGTDGNEAIFDIDVNGDNELFVNESYSKAINHFTISEIFSKTCSSLLLDPNFYNQTFKDRDYPCEKEQKYLMAASFLLGIEGLNYDFLLGNVDNICSYAPKLLYLQIGAAIAMGGNEMNVRYLGDNYHFDDLRIPKKLLEGLKNRQTPLLSFVRFSVLLRYFTDWVDKNYSKISELYVDGAAKIVNNNKVTDIDVTKIKNKNYASIFIAPIATNEEEEKYVSKQSMCRVLLNPKAETVKWLSNELLSTVCFMRLTVDNDNGDNIVDYRVEKGVAIKFLDGFLSELSGLINGTREPPEGMQLALMPQKATESMKIEIYRQLKVVYDKWVCSTKESDWNHLKFFEEGEDYDNPVGNSFFFIDSFYNKMNHALMNPYIIAQKVDLSLTTVDVRVMLANFLSEVYGMHNFMMKCVNNFRMLTKYMDDLFLTHPFNRMPPEKVLPDFVLIYAYEASKYADIPNGEYANDGFMLNDEADTPLPITSRSDKNTYFKIPAFGVSYGRQYQHFFKTVNVDMSQPVATEQATVSKYAILANSRGETYRGVSAQDAFDIYSNQSYTCKLEMMGCAYIQPLMYFVLLNVPFFRGSYLISRVSHHIVPGDMSTTVTGVRMSKYCNHLVRKMLTDQDYYGGGSGGGGGKPYIEPKVDNDCPYKVFPVGNATGSFNGDPVPDGPGGKFANSDQGQKNFCKVLFHTYISAGVNPELAKILVMQDAAESGYGSGGNGPQYYNYGGIVCNQNNCIPGSVYRMFNSIPEYVNYKITKSLSKWDGWKNADSIDGYLTAITSGNHRYFTESYDTYSRRVKGCESRVLDNLKGVNEVPDMTDQQKEEYNNNFGEYFKEAIKKSYESLPSSGEYGSINPVVKNKNHIVVTGGKLSVLFDIILNGYYQYVDKLYWIYQNSPKDNGGEPSKLDLVVKPNSENKANTNRRIYITNSNKSKTEINATYACHEFESENTSQLPESFLNSIVKCYVPRRDIFGKECPQLADCERIFSTFYVNKCGELEKEAMQKVSEYTGRKDVPKSANIKIDNWNVKIAVEWLVSHPKPCRTVGGRLKCGDGKCASFVENAIAGCKDPGCNSETGLPRINVGKNGARYLWRGNKLATIDGNGKGFEIVATGVCNKFKNDRMVPSNVKLQAGDIAVIDTGKGTDGHAAMWSGSEWISDYNQGQRMSPYSSENGNYPFAIFRYHAKEGKITVIQG